MTSTRTNKRDALTPTIGFTCVARPTFVVDYAREAATQAFAALANLGWPIVGNCANRLGLATLVRLGVGPRGYRLLAVAGELVDEPVNRFMGTS